RPPPPWGWPSPSGRSPSWCWRASATCAASWAPRCWWRWPSRSWPPRCRAATRCATPCSSPSSSWCSSGARGRWPDVNRLLRDLLVALALGGLLALLPAALRELFGRSAVSYLTLATNALLLGVLALSWDMLARTGQLSLAHAAFTGVGAYSAAVLLRFAEVPVWLGIPLGGVLAALLALVLGAATLRLYGIYFAIATLAFTEVLRTVVQKLPAHI